MLPTPRSRSRRSLGAGLTLAAAVAALAACGDSVAPRTSALSDAQIAADVAATAGEAIAGEVADFSSDASAAGVASVAAAAPAAVVGCPYDAATRTHVCAAVTERGLEVTRTYQFRDASTTPMQSYDAASTASIYFTRTADGNVTATTETGATWTAATHRSAQQTVSGLLGDETQRVWDGGGESHDTTAYSDAAGSRRYAGAATQTTREVVMKLQHASFPYPTSGTISRSVNYTLTVVGAVDATRTVSRTAVATFNGTALVPLVVNDAVTCTLNLDTGKIGGCGR
ncbi:MAG TPA: hypothetical protein VFJ74_09435 [Gemmatimonadaceae bacterium]|nr:hypothetical protein [Gemmatimonadaceae bacterium]